MRKRCNSPDARDSADSRLSSFVIYLHNSLGDSMLIVAVSSRALFNLEDGHAIYEINGQAAFDRYMRENESKPLRPGMAFPLVRKLLALNTPGTADKVSVMLLSSNTLEAGSRVMHSVQHHGLAIHQAFFTSGGDRFKIARAGKVQLFLSTNAGEVRNALARGMCAARAMPKSRGAEDALGAQLCIAFDGDAVLFSDEAERVYQSEGLSAFISSERTHAGTALGAGPFKPVLTALQTLQQQLVAEGRADLLRVALVTARGTRVHERVLHTFREWEVRLDEAYFLDGAEKGPYLDALGADLFFDDGMHNVESAARFVPSCHVPHGVVGGRLEEPQLASGQTH